MGFEMGCPCCKVYKDGLEYKKVIHLEQAGLVIYRHTTTVNSVASVSQPEKAFNTKDNVFIIHNTKNRNVTTSNYMSELDQAINCPRCKYLVKHTKELLVNIPFIRKKDVIGICDHCRFTKRINERCNKCRVVVEDFLKKKEHKQIETRDSDKPTKVMISKIQHILKDVPKAVFGKSKTQPRSEISLKNRGLNYKTSPTYHVARVKDMFDMQKKTEKYNQQLKKGYLRQIKTIELYKNKSDSEITLIEAKRRKKHNEPSKKILFNSTENLARPGSLQESEEFIGLDNKYQHRLKQKLKPKIDADLPLNRLPSIELEEYLKRENYVFNPLGYETKRWPSEETNIHEKENIKNIKKYQYSYDDIRDSKYDREISKSYDDIRDSKYDKVSKSYDGIHHSKYDQEVSKSYHDIHHSKYNQKISKSSQKKDIFLRGIQRHTRSVHSILNFSKETLVSSASTTTEHTWHKDFSYFFIKESDVAKKPPRKRVSSSELIKDTQDMYRARAEEERIKKEQELKKFEEEEKKRLEKIERKKYLEEERLEELKKKKAEDDKKNMRQIEEEKRLEEEKRTEEEKKIEEKNRIKEEKNNTIKISSKHDTEAQEKSVKSSKDTSGKNTSSIKLKPEIKESKIDKSLKSDRDSIKSKKESDKQEKEESIRLEKERKLKEKLEKREQMRKANEEKQRQKEEKEKANKEEQMYIAKEEKQKEKEQKEKEKANREEQMRKDKEEKQRQKEEKDKDKANKEEKMHIAKEEKQKEKEQKEKEKEKANKEEQMRKDKEEKQRQKEEEEKQKKQLQLDKEQKQREKEQRLKEKEERQKEKEEQRRQKKENENISKKIEEPSTKKQNEEQILAESRKDKKSKLRKKEEEAAKKKEAHLKLKTLKENKTVVEPEPPPIKKTSEESKMKDLNMNEVKIMKDSPDDLILRLVRLKQKRAHLKERPTRLSQMGIPKKFLLKHMEHKNKTESCIICLDSELVLDIENIRLNETKPKEIPDIIIGPKILKYKPSLMTKEDKEIKPLLFTSILTEEAENMITAPEVIEIKTAEKKEKPPILSAKNVEQEVPKGIIRYALSDRTFIEKGWTMLPTEKVVRKMNVYRMRPAHPEFDWFEHNKNRKLICYDTGEKLAEFDDNGKGRWFYRSGKVALDYYDAEEVNAQQRIIIFSSGEPDERGCSRPFAILATFDYLGNGIVFDHSGKIRLKYNQTEGVVLDRAIGPVSHWKWHTLNDPPVLQQVMIDTQMAHKDPEIVKLGGQHDNKPRPDNEEMLAIEFDNFIKEKSKKLSQKFKPFQIKMKALKINEYFSLKVLDQATIYLIYRDGSTNLKLNIGMILDHQEIVDTDTAEVGEVSNSLERFPARTDSLAALQRSVAHAQRAERARVERAQRLRPSQPRSSADRLTAGLARPRPARTDNGSCPCRKPSTFNLYYDTRLI